MLTVWYIVFICLFTGAFLDVFSLENIKDKEKLFIDYMAVLQHYIHISKINKEFIFTLWLYCIY